MFPVSVPLFHLDVFEMYFPLLVSLKLAHYLRVLIFRLGLRETQSKFTLV